MSTRLSDGEIYNYTTTAAVANNALTTINRMVGVALEAATGASVKVPLALTGVFQLTALTTGAMAAGALAYYRTTGSAKKITGVATVATGTTGTTAWCIGHFWETIASGATRTAIRVKLIGRPMEKM